MLPRHGTPGSDRGENASGEDTSGESASGKSTSGEGASGEGASGEGASGEGASGESTSGENAHSGDGSRESASGEDSNDGTQSSNTCVVPDNSFEEARENQIHLNKQLLLEMGLESLIEKKKRSHLQLRKVSALQRQLRST
ncbi:hypothetical protein BDY19DRAFT_909244 [Irpex rosettiformis]|uniref:Uncharacterized protein n=1 Tax=Irpex rosettiformis TaxID=378272 RepID=A0ACB8TSU0_9APHY|nr:hypothetical protein BDY19DRAFT_909244 [Irpex rosettiformis]